MEGGVQILSSETNITIETSVNFDDIIYEQPLFISKIANLLAKTFIYQIDLLSVPALPGPGVVVVVVLVVGVMSMK